MRNRRYAGQEGYRTGEMQDRWDERKWGIQKRTEVGGRDAGQEGFKTGGRQESRDTEKRRNGGMQ